jgi:hypothetical protein
MITESERQWVFRRFGVGEEQLHRDHAISHALGGIAAMPESANLLFYGGTALNRTHLQSRVSEDIDLLVLSGSRNDMSQAVEDAIAVSLQSEVGRPEWIIPFSKRPRESAVVDVDGIQLRVQLLTDDFYTGWPFTPTPIKQRYADAPQIRLNVPTPEAFAGWKTSAWMERHAPRDLFDLEELSIGGYLNSDARTLFAKHGPIGAEPQPWIFDKAPSEEDWNKQLAAQTILRITAAEALATVRSAWFIDSAT